MIMWCIRSKISGIAILTLIITQVISCIFYHNHVINSNQNNPQFHQSHCFVFFVCFFQNNHARLVPINSLRTKDTYVRQETRPPLVQTMACPLFYDTHLSKPMLDHCQMDLWKQTSMKFSWKYKQFHSGRYFGNGFWELTNGTLVIVSLLLFGYTHNSWM